MTVRIIRSLRRQAIGLLALGVALSGTAYAASQIGPKDIQRNAIRTQHIKSGQVKRADLAGRLRRQIEYVGFATITSERGVPIYLGANQIGTVEADCPRGSYSVAGGHEGLSPNSAVTFSVPTDTGWAVGAVNWSNRSVLFRAWAVCLS